MPEGHCNKLQISIFHYHLLPGGVTDVIMGWLQILASYPQLVFPQYREIAVRICCGKTDNILKLQQQWHNWQRQTVAASGSVVFSAEFLVDKEFDYRSLPDNPAFAQLSAEEQALSWQGYVDSLAAHLLYHYAQTAHESGAKQTHSNCDHLWWVHNFHLGKNVAYSKALLQIIQRQTLQKNEHETGQHTARLKFLLHIHDFPECGRFERYKELLQSQLWLDSATATSTESPETLLNVARLYPQSPDLCYATINQRDYKILKEAGLPAERLVFLPNPLKFHDLSTLSTSTRQLQAQLSKALELKYPEKPIALYPVRCIRRKNVLELAFLNILADERWNLICTLPGLSHAERPYSDLVENLYQQGLIQGRCHAGLELEQHGFSFDDLCAAASLIGSSSVMEGFGFTYFNPMYWGKALLARKLDVLHGFDHCFSPQLSLFYYALQIPLAYAAAPDPDLQKLYCNLRQKYSSYLKQLPSAIQTTMQAELETHLPTELPTELDFAYFSIDQQLLLLRRLKSELPSDRDFAAACRQVNAALLSQIETLPILEPNPASQTADLTAAKKLSRRRIKEEFDPEHLAQILKTTCTALFQHDPPKPDKEDPQELSTTKFAGASSTPAQTEASITTMTAISQKVLCAFSKLEYNYAILWDGSWKTQIEPNICLTPNKVKPKIKEKSTRTFKGGIEKKVK